MDFLGSLSDWGYWGLFIASFLSGTVITFSSEALLSLLVIQNYDPWGCILAATTGNWLGGVTCYYIGYCGKIEWVHKYLRISQDKINKTVSFLKGKGSLLGFLGFVPLIGDVIVVALGLMKANRLGSLTSLLAGKFMRYYFIIFLLDTVQKWIPWITIDF